MTKTRLRGYSIVLIVVLLSAVTGILVIQLTGGRNNLSSNGGSLAAFLSQPAEGEFANVSKEYTIELPADHGSHPEFRQEWWYFTGNLSTQAGREFGYQLTFFRFGYPPVDQVPVSRWYAENAWMAHFALTDIEAGRFIAAEDVTRGALDLAGAHPEPFSVWLNGWSVRSESQSCPYCLDATLRAHYQDTSITLRLKSDTPHVLHGEDGYSIKNRDGSVASYYYSLPVVNTAGAITVGGNTHDVSGVSWMDREWSSAMLAKGQSGWDWFALHLEDGSRLMLFQVRQSDGAHFRSGSLIRAGETIPLTAETLSMTVEDRWLSSETGSVYPVRWRVQSDQPDAEFNLQIIPKIENQELNLSFRYYEGAVSATGILNSAPIDGNGYMELTGYE